MTEKKSIRWEHPQQMVKRLQRRQQRTRRLQLWQRVRQVVNALAERWRAVNSLLVADQPPRVEIRIVRPRPRSSGNVAA